MQVNLAYYMTIQDRYKHIIAYFTHHMPEAETELHYRNPFELLVAVILSAQCTDKRVNMTTPSLFEKYPNAHAMSLAKTDELFPLIKSISYPNAKTKHLIAMSKMLIQKYNGNIPMEVSELIKLPGVGRKTANVITSVLDNQPNMAVDTHVFRVSNRIGLTHNSKTVLETEKKLVKNIPSHLIHKAHHWLILHGRYVCVAKNPKCNECGIKPYCKYGSKKRTLF